MDDNIQNWYEKLVLDKIMGDESLEAEFNDEALSDIACLALNHLPTKYVRHTVDMAFYTPPEERAEMDKRINTALDSAIAYVRRHPTSI